MVSGPRTKRLHGLCAAVMLAALACSFVADVHAHDLTERERSCPACALAHTATIEAPCDLGAAPPQAAILRTGAATRCVDLASRRPHLGRAPPHFV